MPSAQQSVPVSPPPRFCDRSNRCLARPAALNDQSRPWIWLASPAEWSGAFMVFLTLLTVPDMPGHVQFYQAMRMPCNRT